MDDDGTPATKGDLRALKMHFGSSMDEKFEKVNAGIDQVLTVLVNVDKRLTGKVKEHDRRIRRLEVAVAG